MSQFENEAAPCRFFFRKENRLLKRADFLRVYGSGRVVRRSLVHVFLVEEPPGPDGEVRPTRIGITATRKTGKAVRRNRARRLVREAFRLNLPAMKPGYSMVVNVMRGATTASYDKVCGQLVSIWRETGVLPSPARPEGQPEKP